MSRLHGSIGARGSGYAALFRGGQYSELSVQLIRFGGSQLASADPASRNRFATWVEIDASGSLALDDIQHVNVENISGLAGRLEPVDVVFVIGDGRIIADRKAAVDRRLDNEVLVFIFQSVVMPTFEFAVEHQERGGHVVVAMRHDATALLQGECLVTEHQICRQALDLRKLGPQAQFTSLAEFQIGRQFLEVDEF